MSIKGFHTCKNEWEIGGVAKSIRVMKFLDNASLRVVNFEDIAVKPLTDKDTNRYRNADTRFPCILAQGVENPLGKEYRMCDGRHRINKLINQGHTDGVFFVISKEQFMKTFKETE